MASPVADSASVASGGTIYGGRSVPVPAWLSGVAVGEWVALPNSTLTTSGAGWTGTSPGGTGTYTSIVIAWGSGVLNTTGIWRAGSFVAGTFLVIFGGGHTDYAGNELYAYGPLENDAPTWSRIIDPTVPGPLDTARSGGYPVSRHTYDTLVYLPTTNQMLCIGAPGYYDDGNTFNVADIFDFDTNPTSNPWSTADTGFPAYGGGGIATIDLVSSYDSATGKAWGLGKGNSQKIGAYLASGGTWQSWDIDNPDLGGNSKAAISQSSSLMVFLSASGAARAVDLRTTPSLFSPVVTGTGPATNAIALDWDAANGRYACWAKTGKTMYFLTPGANPYSGGNDWAWTSNTPAAGVTPANAVANGTFGRFRTSAAAAGVAGYVLMPAHDAVMVFYRTA